MIEMMDAPLFKISGNILLSYTQYDIKYFIGSNETAKYQKINIIIINIIICLRPSQPVDVQAHRTT